MDTTKRHRRWLAAGAALLGLVACSEGAAGPNAPRGEATLFISADVMATIAGVAIEVTAADLDQAIVVNLEVSGGTAAGTVTIPAGAERLIAARAYDRGGVETHRGTETVDVEAGDNVEVTIVLDALNGNQPIVVTFASYTVTFSLPTPALDVGATLQLTATVEDASGPVPGAQVVWGSTNPGVATVDPTGLVTAGLVGGTTTIVATYQGVAASALLTVNPPPVTADLIAFAGTGTQSWWDIYVMNPDGTGVTRLTSDGAIDHNPDISPDGRRIAFRRGELDDIWVMDIDGTNPVPLTNGGGSRTCPKWSPDGARIAYVSDQDGNDEIYVMDADGTNQVRVTNNSVNDPCPAWTSDGTQLMFGSADLYRINPDGTGLVNASNDAFNYFSVALSPDGTRIASRSQAVSGGPDGLVTTNPDGTERQLLVAGFLNNPTWSSDGTRIAFELGGELWVVNADGTGLTNMTAGLTGLESAPSWGQVPLALPPAGQAQ